MHCASLLYNTKIKSYQIFTGVSTFIGFGFIIVIGLDWNSEQMGSETHLAVQDKNSYLDLSSTDLTEAVQKHRFKTFYYLKSSFTHTMMIIC